jgi:uncharacterized protein (TIGR01777 family)
MMRTILITGGTGLIGKALTKALLQKNYKVIILTRKMNHSRGPGVEYALWDVEKKQIDKAALAKADAIIHLAGAGVVEKKWTDAYKKEILDSRVKSSGLIIDTLREMIHKVKVMVSASAIGYYGEDKISGHFFTEEDKADDSFLGEVCRLWEQSTDSAQALGIRVAKLRTGIVLSNEGGAYREFKAPLKAGIASILGSGKQVVSWIHMEDLCRQYIFALEHDEITGACNAVAPHPVSNKELIITIANEVKGKFYLPVHVPGFVLKIMMGKRSVEILKSATVSADKIKKAGFTFLYPALEAAVKALEKK